VGHKCHLITFKALNLSVIGLLSIDQVESLHLEELVEE
jgi:hypothetical protein